MKAITINGHEVNVHSASMNKSHGYGQYTINLKFSWNGEQFKTNIHSTDSKLYDGVRDADDSTEFLCEEKEYEFTDVIHDLVSEFISK